MLRFADTLLYPYLCLFFKFRNKDGVPIFGGNILNFILNAVFLFRFHLGVQGVASATVISKVVNLILIVIFVRRLIPAKNIRRE